MNNFKSSPTGKIILVEERSYAKCIGKDGYNNQFVLQRWKQKDSLEDKFKSEIKDRVTDKIIFQKSRQRILIDRIQSEMEKEEGLE